MEGQDDLTVRGEEGETRGYFSGDWGVGFGAVLGEEVWERRISGLGNWVCWAVEGVNFLPVSIVLHLVTSSGHHPLAL